MKSIIQISGNNTNNAEANKNESIQRFLRRFSAYDLNPPYQREFVWKEERCQKLIESIIEETRIGPISVVRKGERDGNFDNYWVMDGKQRLQTIIHFAKGVFPIPLMLESGPVNIYYKGIQNAAEKGSVVCKNFIELFELYNLDLTIYRTMDFDEQQKKFHKINYSEPFNKNEMIFCSRFVLCQNFFVTIWTNKIVPYIGAYLTSDQRRNFRQTGTRQMANILLLLLGAALKDRYQAKIIDKRHIEDMCQILELQLKQKGLTMTSEISEELIQEFLGGFLVTLEDVAKSVRRILTYRQHYGIVIKGVTVIEFFIFLARYFQSNVFTPNYIIENLETFSKIIAMYTIVKDLVGGMNRQTTNRGKVQEKQDLLDRILKEPVSVYTDSLKSLSLHATEQNVAIRKFLGKKEDWDFKLDLGKKNKPITKIQRNLAVLTSDGRDPVSGSDITKANAHVHHKKGPNSIDSTAAEDMVLLTDATNIKLGGNSDKFVKKAASQKLLFENDDKRSA